jgi:ligand-binding sensor domain-containing protein
MRRVPRLVLLIVPVLLSAAGTLPAAATGGWTTYLRAEQYTSLAARHDTIWCASIEGGLQRFVRSAGRFENLAREPDKLASNALTALEFDGFGRLWIGTVDQGVSLLSADGTRWSLVSRLDGLPDGAVTVLRASGDTVLIGTENGVALWNGSEIAGTVPDRVNPSPFASNVITGALLCGDTLWVATQSGLYVSRASTGLATWTLADDLFSGAPVTGLAWDGRTLMVVSSGVPLVFDFAGGTWSATSGIGAVLSLTDRLGTILACSTAGVYRWSGSVWEALPGAPVSRDCAVASDPACTGIAAATVDAAGRVWVANRDGLREWDSAAWLLHEPDAPAGNNIQNIALQGRRVYITTFVEGVGRFDGERWRNWLPRACVGGCDTTFLYSAYAFSLLVDGKGMKWVGCWNSAMERFDDDVAPPQFTHYRPQDSLEVAKHTFGWSAAADPAGGRWFGMDTNGLGEDPTPIGIEYYDSSGVYRANYRTENTPAMPGSQVRALLVDGKRNHLWVGYRGKGVTVFELPEPGGPLESAGGDLSSTSSLEIFGIVAHRDSIWVMSTADLRLFSASSFLQLRPPLPLTGSPATPGACHPLDVGPDGTVWVGTDGGVHAYGRGGSVVEYTTLNSPLAGDEVRAIRVDPVTGVVWIGTATGLSRFDPAYVPPVQPDLPTLEVSVYPSPAWLTGAGLTLRLAGNAAAYRGVVYDASGRKLHGFAGRNGQSFWDGRDASGALVHPGVYFVRIEASGRARTVRVALLR